MVSKPLIVIVGPTASGKTALAIDLAERFGGEIICADSRTVYKGMDIGTAKPTEEERARVSHWGLDLVEPDQRYTAADFKKYAEQKIIEIRSRGHIPFLVGGSGLYIDAVIFDYKFGDQADEKLRRNLEKMSVNELQDYCRKNNIQLPENDKNKRYLVRAVEQKSINSRRNSEILNNAFIVGIATDKSELRRRIEQRANKIFEKGIVDEAKRLGNEYGWGHEAMTGNIYPLCREYLGGNLSIEEAKQKFITQDWRLAKRQLTWFRRNKFIEWRAIPEAKERIISLLASEH